MKFRSMGIAKTEEGTGMLARPSVQARKLSRVSLHHAFPSKSLLGLMNKRLNSPERRREPLIQPFIQGTHNRGFHIHPSLTDALTHLGAILDTDKLEAARVPHTLGLYRPVRLKKHVSNHVNLFSLQYR